MPYHNEYLRGIKKSHWMDEKRPYEYSNSFLCGKCGEKSWAQVEVKNHMTKCKKCRHGINVQQQKAGV